jgi:hypothetical protein
MMRIGGWMLAMLCVAGTASAKVSIVRDGKVRAVVVTAVKPSEVAAYAAKELVYHIEKATGQRLQVVVETAIPKGYTSCIFVGDTEATRKQGLDPDKLEIEEFILRTVGSDLYIAGKELHPDQKVMYEILSPQREPRNPLSTHNVYSGTLFGVYEMLDRYLGVRWLWPGELGTYVPRTSTIEIAKVDEMVAPRLLYRDLGGWELEQMHVTGSYYGRKITPSFKVGRITEKLCRNLIFPTEEAGYTYGRAMEVYNRRHRRVTPIEEPLRVPRTGHQTAGINDWWAAYGKEHPEWFAMRADGQRGLKVPRAGAYTDLCISNPTCCINVGMKNETTGGHEFNLAEKRFIEGLRRHPQLWARFQSILELTRNADGPLKTADEMEELLIQELRALGRTSMNDFATQAEERVGDELKGRDATVHSRKKNADVVVCLWGGQCARSDLAQPEQELSASLARAIGRDPTRPVAAAGSSVDGFWQRTFLCAGGQKCGGTLRL